MNVMKNALRVYQFKITLEDIKPQIWRRIQVPENYSFWALHVAIQDSMGWQDYHLHNFSMLKPATGKMVNITFSDEDYRAFNRSNLSCHREKIAKYFSVENRDADYIYDFGDNWEHSIMLEKILPVKEGTKYPLCTGGKRACPPEDCGGVPGYNDLLKILSNPRHPEYKSMLIWVGGKFDPEHFDPKEVVFDDTDERWEFATGSHTE
jgi:hypothetical protein